ncbi:phage minor capsid protein [Corynebacterium sp.]|uniref:phage minor capsid protein n=1 Tax=Corynebacterium sp. TaxID=1720 RepID=UPI002A908E83|nr:phage minor capsid protein [Corynebacterium sp.]MDY5785871.1 phage minor capsid protein [Corynebacterium sp.]
MTTKQDIHDLVEGYRRAEVHILRLLTTTAATAVETRDWYEQQHLHLQRLMREARRVMSKAAPTEAELTALINDGFAEGYAETGESAPVARFNSQAMAEATQETLSGLTMAGFTVLRTTEDVHRQVARLAMEGQLVSGANRTARLQSMLDDYARRGVTSFVDGRGRRWGIDTYAETVLRTGVNRAQNAGRLRGYQDHGVELVHCSQHLGADAHCQPFQNSILAISGDAGPRRMVDPATGKQVTVDVYATLNDAVSRGLLHVNCRHTLTAYSAGMPLPETVDATDEHYVAEQEQRHNERMIRQWKRMQATALTPERARQAEVKVREWQARQREHLGRHSWLVRRYDRERLWKGRSWAGMDNPPPLKTPTPEKKARATTPKPKSKVLAPATTSINRDVKKKTPKQQAHFDKARDVYLNSEMTVRGHEVPYKRRYATLGDVPLLAKPATWDEVKDSTNPRYGDKGFGVNCQRVTAAAEMRLRGYDLTAGSGSVYYKVTMSDVGDVLQGIKARGLSRLPSTYQMSVAWRTAEGKARLPYKASEALGKGGVNMQTVRDMQDLMPEGARGFAVGLWSKQNSGHIWNWVKKDGEIKFFEAQSKTGFVDVDDYLDSLQRGSLEMIRVDDLTPTDQVLGVISVE